MHIVIQIVKHVLSKDTTVLGGIGKPLQMCSDEIEFGERSAVHYIFAESQ